MWRPSDRARGEKGIRGLGSEGASERKERLGGVLTEI